MVEKGRSEAGEKGVNGEQAQVPTKHQAVEGAGRGKGGSIGDHCGRH